MNEASFSNDDLKIIPTFGSGIQKIFITRFFRRSLFDKKRYQNIKTKLHCKTRPNFKVKVKVRLFSKKLPVKP